LSAEILPADLQRLVGQHPAALRLVRWPQALSAHVEIETKHGLVVLIDCHDGTVRANPALPPGVDAGARLQEDLTGTVPAAFDGRPVFQAIAALRDSGRLTGWRFDLSTGIVLTVTPGAPVPVRVEAA
jgi:hypothetical protein